MPRRHCNNKSEPGRLVSGVRLATCVIAFAVCWLLLLPLAAQQPAIHNYIERNERLGVDPSAKFYSELPAMPAIADRVDQIRNQHALAFWTRSVQ
jgi:hypothetical protein